MPVISGGKVEEGVLRLMAAKASYDFAIEGGAVGTVTLRNGELPAAAIILGGFVEVTTAVASATGTVALQAEAAADLLAATGQAGLTLGRKSIIPAFTGAASVKTTIQRQIQMTVATAVLTAGKFDVTVFFVV